MLIPRDLIYSILALKMKGARFDIWRVNKSSRSIDKSMSMNGSADIFWDLIYWARCDTHYRYDRSYDGVHEEC